MSENITVRSIVDRFLEHSRVYYFENACQPQVFISSADWMPRNFFRRIELAIPVEDGVLRERLISEVLAISLADNSKARFLQAGRVVSARHRRPRRQTQPQPVPVHGAGAGGRGMRPQAGGRQDPVSGRQTCPVAVRRAEAKEMTMNLYILRHGIAVEPGTPRLCERRRPAADPGRRTQVAAHRRGHGSPRPLLRPHSLQPLPARAANCGDSSPRPSGRARSSNSPTASRPAAARTKLVELLNHLQPVSENVLLVGHEPYLSGLISLLVSGEQNLAVAMKKAGLCKLTTESLKHGRCAALEWLLTPKQMALMT